MNDNKIQNKIINAAKWSSITEIAAKIVTPDAGIRKYLIQHEFSNEDEKFDKANVDFWTNLGITFLLWTVIILYSEEIAVLVGNAGLGNVITIACVQLPLSSFSR